MWMYGCVRVPWVSLEYKAPLPRPHHQGPEPDHLAEGGVLDPAELNRGRLR